MKRHGRALEEWIEAECTGVHQECRRQAESRGLKVPTIEEVAAAERYARGSIDYGATWAYQLARMMTRAPGASTQ